MQHLAEHFESGKIDQDMRPDFFVIEYMRAEGLMSEEDFKVAMSYSERPNFETLVPFDHKMPGKPNGGRREDAVVQVYSRKGEERQRQRHRRHKTTTTTTK